MNDKIFPVAKDASELPGGNLFEETVQIARSKLEQDQRLFIASCHALQGYLTSCERHGTVGFAARECVDYATALIRELDSRSDSK